MALCVSTTADVIGQRVVEELSLLRSISQAGLGACDA